MSRCALLALALLIHLAPSVRAESPMLATATLSPMPTNFPSATMGGYTFWTDELVHGGWRIQQNALSGHYRLLDDQEFRRGWGTFAQCQAKLDELKRLEGVPTPQGRAVITLHGLIRSRDQMEGLGRFLQEEGQYTWVNMSYASTRRPLDDHAQALARVIEHLPEVETIDLVCHSMGNLVVRRYLGEATLPQPRWQPDRRIRRMVMLGPPNGGAQMAKLFKQNQLYSVVTGPSGKTLACDWEQAAKTLATPHFDFGIIAGGLGNGRGLNPLVNGDDDLIVAVEETKLSGARDFCIVNCRHGEMMDDEHVRERTLRFLKSGHFVSEQDRRPLVSTQAKDAPPAKAGATGQ